MRPWLGCSVVCARRSGRLGASGASKRLDSGRRVPGQWPDVCAGTQVAKAVQIVERQSMCHQVEGTMGCEHVVASNTRFDQALEEQMATLGFTELRRTGRKSRLFDEVCSV